MMTYTETGLALMAEAVMSGTQIQFTRIELLADPERSARNLVYQAEIASVSVKDSVTVLLKAVTDNYGYTDDYYFNQINVYASSGDGKENLFCFQKSETCPFYIPKFDGRPVQNEISIYITVTSTDAVSIVNDGPYLLKTEFDNRIKLTCNIIVVGKDEQIPENRTANTWYLKVTDQQTLAASDTIIVSPSMGIKLV